MRKAGNIRDGLPARLVAGALLVWLAVLASPAGAQPAYPAKTVRVVVPFPPGGTNDIVARIVARELQELTAQPFVVDNRPGASGVIGAELVAKSLPDGYTLMVHSVTHLSNAYAYKKLPYDTLKDFEPVALMAAQPGVLVVHPSMPVRTVREFIALARSRPGHITYASNGEGGSLHVQMALFAAMARINLIHVPYKGGAPAATSLVSGETQSAFATVGIVLPHISSQRLRPIATSSARPSSLLPALPTVDAAGVPGYDMNPWTALFAPAGTPRTVIDRLHAEVNRILGKNEVQKLFREQTVESWTASREVFADQIKRDSQKFDRIFKLIGAKPS